MADPEIDAMASIATALNDLDPETRSRVLDWARAKYQGLKGDKPQELGDLGEKLSFDHFAELFNAASPASKDEKVLVAGYWFQKLQARDSFQSLELNKELKDLGHEVDHISQALDINVKKRPALVLQLRKAGSTAQARKTYKLTVEGMNVVEQMIATP